MKWIGSFIFASFSLSLSFVFSFIFVWIELHSVLKNGRINGQTTDAQIHTNILISKWIHICKTVVRLENIQWKMQRADKNKNALDYLIKKCDDYHSNIRMETLSNRKSNQNETQNKNKRENMTKTITFPKLEGKCQIPNNTILYSLSGENFRKNER